MDISEAPPLDWQVLNDETQVASKDGTIVAIAYTVHAGDVNGAPSYEFCWKPVDDPDYVEVHFGLSPGIGAAWDNRWKATRKATEWDFAMRAAT
jgi:hypothetical protein